MNKQGPLKKKARAQESQIERLTRLITELKEDQALEILKKMLTDGFEPTDLLNSCLEGMRRVGLLFEKRQYFISALIMAGEIQRRVVELLAPHLSPKEHPKTSGRVLVGTVQGDIHDIGKNLFCNQLQIGGIEVIDLGVDVSPDTFLSETQKLNPDLVGLSCVLTSCISALKNTVEFLRLKLPDKRPQIIIGGTCVDRQILEYTQADLWGEDALAGVRMCRRIITQKTT